MSLKELLGEELYNQVIEKAGDSKVAVVSDGNWIPKDKFDRKIQEVKDLQGKMEDRDNELVELKKIDPEKLQQTITDMQKKHADDEKEWKERLQQQEFEHKLQDTLKESGVRNVRAVKALLDTESIKLDGEKLLGLDEQLEKIKETDDYLFNNEEAGNGPQIFNPGNPKGGSGNTVTKEQIMKETDTNKRQRLIKENSHLFQ